MSIIIRGMKMPETCDECQFHRYCGAGEYVCEATPMFYPWNLANIKGIRKEWCPLVELPPHGRLIDADALCERLEKAVKIKPYLAGAFNGAISFALTAPTIIEAEEE